MTPNYYPGCRTLEEIEEEARQEHYAAVIREDVWEIVDELKDNFKSEVEDATVALDELDYLKMLNSAALELAEFAQARASELGVNFLTFNEGR